MENKKSDRQDDELNDILKYADSVRKSNSVIDSKDKEPFSSAEHITFEKKSRATPPFSCSDDLCQRNFVPEVSDEMDTNEGSLPSIQELESAGFFENFDHTNVPDECVSKHTDIKRAASYIVALLTVVAIGYVSCVLKMPQRTTSVNGLPVNQDSSYDVSENGYYRDEEIPSIDTVFDDNAPILTAPIDEEINKQEESIVNEAVSKPAPNNNPVKNPKPNPPSTPDGSFENGEVNPPPETIPDDNISPPSKPPEESSDSPDTSQDLPPANDNVQVTIKGNKVTMSAQEAVAGWVATEINYLYPVEAIKAQAVAAYTYIKYYNASGQAPSIAIASPHANLTNAVESVIGKAIYNGNKLAFTPWFAMSIGITLDSEQVWGGTVSNLKSVDSSIEQGYSDGYSNFKTTVTYSASSIKAKIENIYGITLSDNKKNWFAIKSYHQTTQYEGKTIGYVNAVSIDGQKQITGRKVRENILNLLDGKRFRSSAFDEPQYNSTDDTFTFTVYGYGHGCGMSQVGAKLYAKNGWSYQDILAHYYKGVTIK